MKKKITSPLFAHTSKSAIRIMEEAKLLKTSGVIYACNYWINKIKNKVELDEDLVLAAIGAYQCLREAERRGLALDLF